MKKFKYICLTLFALLITINTFSQEEDKDEKVKLTIVVKDANNEAVPGAIILIDDVKQKRVANAAGFFKVKLDKAPKEITAYSPLVGVKKVSYKGNNTMIINITNNNDNLVTNAYELKGAEAMQYRDIYDYLRGKVAGVNVNLNNGITIRGISSVNGNNSPLLILNGVQVDQESFSAIVPTTIISIKVLKGPESAIYGVRGSAGVIEVKTAI